MANPRRGLPSNALPDFGDRRVVDRTLEKLDTHGVSRRDFLKLTSATFVAAAGAAVFGACGDDDNSASTTTTPVGGTVASLTTGKVASFFLFAGNEWYTEYGAAAKSAASSLGLSFSDFSAEQNSQTQLSQYEQQAPLDLKLAMINAPDGSSIPRILQLATQYKVRTVINHQLPDWFTPFDADEYFVGYQGADEISGGKLMGQAAIDGIGGAGNIVHLEGLKGATASLGRTAGVDEALKSAPNVKVVARENGDWDPVKAQTVLETIMSRTTDFGAVICNNDGMAVGAVAALKARGLNQVKVIGNDGTMDVIDQINSGDIYGTLASFPHWFGAAGVVWAFDALNGFQRSAPERMMMTPGVMVLAGDLATRYAARYGGSSASFNHKLMSHVIHANDWDEQIPLKVLDPEYFYKNISKPSGWTYPAELAAARDAGKFETINALYAEHQKSDPFGAVPA